MRDLFAINFPMHKNFAVLLFIFFFRQIKNNDD